MNFTIDASRSFAIARAGRRYAAASQLRFLFQRAPSIADCCRWATLATISKEMGMDFVWYLPAGAAMMWPLFLDRSPLFLALKNCSIVRFGMDKFKQLIRGVPDFPKKGILFYDITTLLKNAKALKEVLDELGSHYRSQKIDLVVGIESRGFIFAPALACQLGAGFVPVRKPGKLPAETIKVTYDLEYGTDTLEIHKDAIIESGW